MGQKDNQNNLTEEQRAELYQKKLAKKGAHRNEYKNLLDSINQNHYNSINAIIVFRFICYLKNWGTYTKNETQNFYDWFLKNRKDLIDKLDEFLETEINRQQVKFAFQQVMKLIEKADGYQEKDYYLEFIDDLNMLLCFTTKTPFFNLFYPNVYSKEAYEYTSVFRYEFERAKTDKNYKSKVLKIGA